MKIRILAVLLAVCMCLGMVPTAFAAESGRMATMGNSEIMPIDGTETWNLGKHIVGSFTLWGHNRTPVKTIGHDGYLRIYLEFDTENVGREIVVQIEDADTLEVLVEWRTHAVSWFEGYPGSPGLKVTKGQRIRVDFWLYDRDGNYDDNGKQYLTYGYDLSTTSR